MNPMSSMRSASSRTRMPTLSSFAMRCSIRSRSRPGVATRTSTPVRRAWAWGFWPTPPKTTVWRRWRWRPYRAKLSPIWEASSRVGESTRTRTWRGLGTGTDWSRWRMGSANAAVLPVPVWAQPSRSLPSRTCLIVCCWIGVGFSYPSSRTARRRGSIRGSSSKRIMKESCGRCSVRADGTGQRQSKRTSRTGWTIADPTRRRKGLLQLHGDAPDVVAFAGVEDEPLRAVEREGPDLVVIGAFQRADDDARLLAAHADVGQLVARRAEREHPEAVDLRALGVVE